MKKAGMRLLTDLIQLDLEDIDACTIISLWFIQAKLHTYLKIEGTREYGLIL
jgi:hypothetical protein